MLVHVNEHRDYGSNFVFHASTIISNCTGNCLSIRNRLVGGVLCIHDIVNQLIVMKVYSYLLFMLMYNFISYVAVLLLYDNNHM